MTRLNSTEVRHLVALKSMLSDASRLASRAGPHQRVTAVVLLDGAAERALHLVAVTRALPVSPKQAEFNALVDLVRSAMPAWRPATLADVRQLHRARNSAQHEGLAPDRAALAPWSSAVEAFVLGLVDAQFGVDLNRLTSAEAVAEETLRARLRQAQQALERGETDVSVDLSRQSVTDALTRWDALHWTRDRAAETEWERYDRWHRPTDPLVHSLEREIRLSTFAQAPAEAAWFSRLVEGPFDADDAERALAFAVNWVLGYESSAQVWTPDRRARADRASRLARSGNGPAVVHSVIGAHLHGRRGAQVSLSLASVPADDAEFSAWADAVSAALGGDPGGYGDDVWRIRGDGTAHIFLRKKARVEVAIAELAEGLRRAEFWLVDTRRERDARGAARAASSLAFAEALSAGPQPPPWVREVAWDPGDDGVSAVAVALREDAVRVCTVRAGDAPYLQRLLRRDARVGLAKGTSDGRVLISPGLEPSTVVELLWNVDREVEALLEEFRSQDRSLARDADSLSRRVRLAVDAASVVAR